MAGSMARQGWRVNQPTRTKNIFLNEKIFVLNLSGTAIKERPEWQ